MKINYTDFLKKYRTEETDRKAVAGMHNKLVGELRQAGIHGRVRATYYTDGCIKVELNGTYFNIFCTVTNTWFHGSVGDVGLEKYPYDMEKERPAGCQSTHISTHIVA